MNSRRGKKGSITKRIQQIDRIVGEGGSRSKIEFLVSALIEVQKAMQGVCEELMTIATDTDSEYLDNENLRIDTCIAEAKEYLERRKNDPPSTGSLCESWVQKHNAVNDFVSEDDAVSDVTKGFAGNIVWSAARQVRIVSIPVLEASACIVAIGSSESSGVFVCSQSTTVHCSNFFHSADCSTSPTWDVCFHVHACE